jgi:DNA-binding CsgD family transcriptional regulator
LVIGRLFLATAEAIACAGSEIPEYTGGKNTPPVGQLSPGALRTAALLVATRVIADSLRGWADEIDAEDASQAAGGAEAASAGKPAAQRRKRKRQPVKGKALTPRQAEVVHIVGECKGDFAAVGRRLGIDRKTVEQHYNAAMQKLGKAAVKHATQPLRSDRRGQADLTPEDDRRR